MNKEEIQGIVANYIKEHLRVQIDGVVNFNFGSMSKQIEEISVKLMLDNEQFYECVLGIQ